MPVDIGKLSPARRVRIDEPLERRCALALLDECDEATRARRAAIVGVLVAVGGVVAARILLRVVVVVDGGSGGGGDALRVAQLGTRARRPQ